MILIICMIICYFLGFRYGCGLGSLALGFLAFYFADILGLDLNPYSQVLLTLFVVSAPLTAIISSSIIHKYCFLGERNRFLIGIFAIFSFWFVLSSISETNLVEQLMLGLYHAKLIDFGAIASLLCERILFLAAIISISIIGFSLAFELPFEFISHISLRSKSQRLQGLRVLLVILAFVLGLELIRSAFFRYLNPESII